MIYKVIIVDKEKSEVGQFIYLSDAKELLEILVRAGYNAYIEEAENEQQIIRKNV